MNRRAAAILLARFESESETAGAAWGDVEGDRAARSRDRLRPKILDAMTRPPLTAAQGERLRDIVDAYARALGNRMQYDDDRDSHGRLCARELAKASARLDAFIARYTEQL